jgi:hypothetical protein
MRADYFIDLDLSQARDHSAQNVEITRTATPPPDLARGVRPHGNRAIPGRGHRVGVSNDGVEESRRPRLTYGELSKARTSLIAWSRNGWRVRSSSAWKTRGTKPLSKPVPPHEEFFRAGLLGRMLRLAVVARPEMIDPHQFGVTVAANRGLVSNIFTAEAEAIAWLASRQGPGR